MECDHILAFKMTQVAMWVDVVGEIKRRYATPMPMYEQLQAGKSGLVFHQGDGSGGSGLTLTPANGNYSSLFVWLHGLGDTPFSWYGAYISTSDAKSAADFMVNIHSKHS